MAKKKSKPKPEGTLYERVGGAGKIAEIVSTFCDECSTDCSLSDNPDLCFALQRIPMACVKYLATEFLCFISGGPQRHTGPTICEVFDQIRLRSIEFSILLGNFQHSLVEYDIGLKERAEFTMIFVKFYNEWSLADRLRQVRNLQRTSPS